MGNHWSGTVSPCDSNKWIANEMANEGKVGQMLEPIEQIFYECPIQLFAHLTIGYNATPIYLLTWKKI